MGPDEERLANNAIEYIKTNVNLIIKRFADDSLFLSYNNPASVFMAGSPGAGKTEFSKRLIKNFETVVRIDPDEIRDILPDYDGKNSFIFQGAASLGVNKLHDYVLKYKKNFILDGTFSNYERSRDNVKRSLDKGRPVLIYYVYQGPIIAWDFTQKREALEGRHIPKEIFIKDFFMAKDAVDKVKVDFGNNIEVDLVVKDFTANTERIELNIEKIDNYLKVD